MKINSAVESRFEVETETIGSRAVFSGDTIDSRGNNPRGSFCTLDPRGGSRSGIVARYYGGE